MGLPSPQEAAPAYEDVMHNDHPMSIFTPSASSSSGVRPSSRHFCIHQRPQSNKTLQYTSVPQEDFENVHDEHTHKVPSPAPVPPHQPETFAQTLAGVFKKQPHAHCEACDKQMEARERRANQRHCCSMVAAVFIALFFCIMILGIVIADEVAKMKTSGHF